MKFIITLIFLVGFNVPVKAGLVKKVGPKNKEEAIKHYIKENHRLQDETHKCEAAISKAWVSLSNIPAIVAETDRNAARGERVKEILSREFRDVKEAERENTKLKNEWLKCREKAKSILRVWKKIRNR